MFRLNFITGFYQFGHKSVVIAGIFDGLDGLDGFFRGGGEVELKAEFKEELI